MAGKACRKSAAWETENNGFYFTGIKNFFLHPNQAKIVPAPTAYILWRRPKPEDTTFFKNFSCCLSLCVASPALADSVQPSASKGMIILCCDQWQFQRQGLNFSLCFGESRRRGKKTISPVRPTRRWEESHTYLCLLAVHPLLPSLGPPFRPSRCPQGRRGSALAGCGGSCGGGGRKPLPPFRACEEWARCWEGEQSCCAPPARKQSHLCV